MIDLQVGDRVWTPYVVCRDAAIIEAVMTSLTGGIAVSVHSGQLVDCFEGETLVFRPTGISVPDFIASLNSAPLIDFNEETSSDY